MSNEEIEELETEVELELGLEKGDTKTTLKDYLDSKGIYETRLSTLEKNSKAHKYEQWAFDTYLDGYEGKISSNDSFRYASSFHSLAYYYANKDDEIKVRRNLQKIESKILQLKSERIYNGKLLSNQSEIEQIKEQLSIEKNNIEQVIAEAVENQSDWLLDLSSEMKVLAEKNPKYNAFDSMYFSIDNPKLSSNLEEIGRILEGDAIELEKKQEYVENKSKYKDIQSKMDRIKNNLVNNSNQLSNLQKNALKKEYKELYKEKVDIQNDTPIDIISDEKSNQNENNPNIKKEEEKDYSRLVAAQNESNRRLKIKNISNTLSKENLKKKAMAIISGICFAGLIVATHFSGIDPKEAIATELQALNSFDSLKEYIGTFTPAMLGTMIASAVSLSKYIKHNKKYKNANQEFYDIMDNSPEDYQDIVEQQAKGR